MKRSVSISKVLGLFVLLAFLTGCAAEKEPLIISPLSHICHGTDTDSSGDRPVIFI